MNIKNLELINEYVDIQSFLETLDNYGDEYDFLLIHCYAHIKNEEIYLEIDKDIYEHVIIYEGKNFYDAVKQYFFMLKRGAILIYKKNTYPTVKMEFFKDSFDDFETFEKEIDSFAKSSKAFAYIKSDSKSAVLTYIVE